MIIFESIRYKNLLASGNYWTDIPLNKDQNTLIVGSNGSGKSTILDALCLGLFGKPFRNVNKPLLVNSINKKDCLIEIKFNTNGKSYLIVRGIKPNIFQIFVDGELLNQEAAMKDYQEILEKSILKFNFKSFTQIVILGSASFIPFMQLSSGDRRTIIEDLLDIHIFSTMNLVVKDRASNNKELIEGKKNSILLVEQKYNIEKKHLHTLKEDSSQKIVEFETEITKSSNTVSKLLEDIESLMTISEELKVFIVKKQEVEANVKKLIKIESTVEGRLSKNKKDIEFFNNNDQCPVCRQNINDGFKYHEVTKLSGEVLEIQEGLKKLEERLNKEQQELNVISDKQKDLHRVQIKIASNNTAITETNKYIQKLQKQIVSLRTSSVMDSTDDKMLLKISEELNELKESLKLLLEDKMYFDAAIALLKDGGIKTKIIKQYLPIINKLVNRYLSALDFFVNFNLDESFKETIKSRYRDDFVYNNFSEGQKQRIDMALMLTWRDIAKIKNSAHTNILFLDEIFDKSLDDEGAEYLMKILNTLDEVNLFVISHRGDILNDKFSKTIKFDMAKNFSRIKKVRD